MDYKIGDGEILYEVFSKMDTSNKMFVYPPYKELTDSQKGIWEKIAEEYNNRLYEEDE